MTVHTPGFIADTDDEAKQLYYPRYKVIRHRIGAQRGWPPLRREEFDAEIADGSMYIGSPETVAPVGCRVVRMRTETPGEAGDGLEVGMDTTNTLCNWSGPRRRGFNAGRSGTLTGRGGRGRRQGGRV
jgi:hypothetical protein